MGAGELIVHGFGDIIDRTPRRLNPQTRDFFKGPTVPGSPESARIVGPRNIEAGIETLPSSAATLPLGLRFSKHVPEDRSASDTQKPHAASASGIANSAMPYGVNQASKSVPERRCGTRTKMATSPARAPTFV